jgi:hypothetical protein
LSVIVAVSSIPIVDRIINVDVDVDDNIISLLLLSPFHLMVLVRKPSRYSSLPFSRKSSIVVRCVCIKSVTERNERKTAHSSLSVKALYRFNYMLNTLSI